MKAGRLPGLEQVSLPFPMCPFSIKINQRKCQCPLPCQAFETYLGENGYMPYQRGELSKQEHLLQQQCCPLETEGLLPLRADGPDHSQHVTYELQ